MATLEREYEYYRTNQDEFDRKYSGKAVVIKDEQVIGVYATKIEAIQETQKNHSIGTFLVQLCSPEGNTPLVFHSRVVFS